MSIDCDVHVKDPGSALALHWLSSTAETRPLGVGKTSRSLNKHTIIPSQIAQKSHFYVWKRTKTREISWTQIVSDDTKNKIPPKKFKPNRGHPSLGQISSAPSYKSRRSFSGHARLRTRARVIAQERRRRCISARPSAEPRRGARPWLSDPTGYEASQRSVPSPIPLPKRPSPATWQFGLGGGVRRTADRRPRDTHFRLFKVSITPLSLHTPNSSIHQSTSKPARVGRRRGPFFPDTLLFGAGGRTRTPLETNLSAHSHLVLRPKDLLVEPFWEIHPLTVGEPSLTDKNVAASRLSGACSGSFWRFKLG